MLFRSGILQTVYRQPTRIARRQKHLGIAQTASLPRRFGMVQGKMTFSHQMIRPIFVEQLYRAMTILRGEPYHHP